MFYIGLVSMLHVLTCQLALFMVPMSCRRINRGLQKRQILMITEGLPESTTFSEYHSNEKNLKAAHQRIGIALLVVFLFFSFFVYLGFSKTDSDSSHKAGPVSSEVLLIKGTLVQIDPDYGILKTPEDKIFHIRPQRGFFVNGDLRGANVIAKVVPYRRSEKNEKRALCLNLQKIRNNVTFD